MGLLTYSLALAGMDQRDRASAGQFVLPSPASRCRSDPDAQVVAVAFPPWWTRRDAFTAAALANAEIVRTTAIPAVLVVKPDIHEGLLRLRQAGAWLTLDPKPLPPVLEIKTKEI